jgi:methylmalonyl-CoA mutase
MEVAKLRAARYLWATMMQDLFAPKDARSLMLRTHCQTSGVSLAAKDPYNNVIRTTIEAMAAVLGGTQSLHTNSLDEALALPTPFSARIARNTQLVLQEETGITRVVDPLAGSFYVESLTASVAAEALKLIQEVEALGGMTQAVQSGLPKQRIEESAARKQARIDSGEDVIVGVNKYVRDDEDEVELLEVDNAEVRASQIKRLQTIKSSRDANAVAASLNALRDAARSEDGNLLDLAIRATRARATVGEISEALADIFTRHHAKTRTISGVYGKALANDPAFQHAKNEVAEFTKTNGNRAPRLLIVKMGQDGHDRGAKVIATAFTDLGFDVTLGELFQSPAEAAQEAIHSGAQAIGVSTLAGGHKTLVPQLIEELKARGAEDVAVIVGGVMPASDHQVLLDAGVAQIYGPGANIPNAARDVLGFIKAQPPSKWPANA